MVLSDSMPIQGCSPPICKDKSIELWLHMLGAKFAYPNHAAGQQFLFNYLMNLLNSVYVFAITYYIILMSIFSFIEYDF